MYIHNCFVCTHHKFTMQFTHNAYLVPGKYSIKASTCTLTVVKFCFLLPNENVYITCTLLSFISTNYKRQFVSKNYKLKVNVTLPITCFVFSSVYHHVPR